MDSNMIFVKAGIDITGAAASAILAIFAAGESTPITYSAIVAVLGFAGLLVRQIVNNQKLYIGIVAAKDAEITERVAEIHYLRWEIESMRFRHGERAIDPGLYIPRTPPAIGASS